MIYLIALSCVDLKDQACIDECPVDCIYESERSLYIHHDECVDFDHPLVAALPPQAEASA